MDKVISTSMKKRITSFRILILIFRTEEKHPFQFGSHYTEILMIKITIIYQAVITMLSLKYQHRTGHI